MRLALAALAAVAVWLYWRRRNRRNDSWASHVQDAINLAGPVEHVVRPMYEHVPIDGFVHVYCTDCDAFLIGGYLTEGELVLARATHTRQAHAVVTA